jgi:hypothetical protein
MDLGVETHSDSPDMTLPRPHPVFPRRSSCPASTASAPGFPVLNRHHHHHPTDSSLESVDPTAVQVPLHLADEGITTAP